MILPFWFRAIKFSACEPPKSPHSPLKSTPHTSGNSMLRMWKDEAVCLVLLLYSFHFPIPGRSTALCHLLCHVLSPNSTSYLSWVDSVCTSTPLAWRGMHRHSLNGEQVNASGCHLFSLTPSPSLPQKQSGKAIFRIKLCGNLLQMTWDSFRIWAKKFNDNVLNAKYSIASTASKLPSIRQYF